MLIQREAGGKFEMRANKEVLKAQQCFGRFLTWLCFVSPQADVSWSVNGVPKGIIKQSMGQLPIMVKSKLCNLHGMSPKELVEHHEEAEVRHVRNLRDGQKFIKRR